MIYDAQVGGIFGIPSMLPGMTQKMMQLLRNQEMKERETEKKEREEERKSERNKYASYFFFKKKKKIEVKGG